MWLVQGGDARIEVRAGLGRDRAKRLRGRFPLCFLRASATIHGRRRNSAGRADPFRQDTPMDRSNTSVLEETSELQRELDRRRPGQSEIVTPRKEADAAEILSGLHDGLTLGTPVSIIVRNTDQRPGAYDEMAVKYRPSHADYTYDAKYGIRAPSGGGRASARETIGRVAAAAVARQVLDTLHPGIEILAWVKSIQDLNAEVDPSVVSSETIESNIVRTGDPEMVDRHVLGDGEAVVRLDAVECAHVGDGGAAERITDGVAHVREHVRVAAALLDLVEEADAGVAVAPAEDPRGA